MVHINNLTTEIQKPWTYYIYDEESSNRHWRKANIVEVCALPKINAKQATQLANNVNGQASIKPNTPLAEYIKRDMQATCQAAQDAGVTPRPQPGKVYKKAESPSYSYAKLTGQNKYVFVTSPGTPVLMDQKQLDQDQMVNAIHAMNHTDQPLVPVQDTVPTDAVEEDDIPFLTGVHALNDTSQTYQEVTTKKQFAPGRDMSVELDIEGLDDPVRLPTNLIIKGATHYEYQIHYEPETIQVQEVAEEMLRAFWTDSDSELLDEPEQRFSETRQEFTEEATAGMMSQTQGFTQQLQRLSDQINLTIQPPQETVSVTSKNGPFSITYHPEKEEPN